MAQKIIYYIIIITIATCQKTKKKDPRRTEGDSLPNNGSKWKEKKQNSNY
jgi:hypothetical protein